MKTPFFRQNEALHGLWVCSIEVAFSGKLRGRPTAGLLASPKSHIVWIVPFIKISHSSLDARRNLLFGHQGSSYNLADLEITCLDSLPAGERLKPIASALHVFGNLC